MEKIKVGINGFATVDDSVGIDKAHVTESLACDAIIIHV